MTISHSLQKLQAFEDGNTNEKMSRTVYDLQHDDITPSHSS